MKMDAKKMAKGIIDSVMLGLLHDGFADDPDKDCENEESARGHDHDRPVGPPASQDPVAPEAACPQEFTNKRDCQEYVGVSKPGSQAVHQGEHRLVLQGKSLDTPHDDAVCDDQSHIGAELLPHLWVERLEHDVYDDDEGGDDHGFHHHPDTGWYVVSDQREREARKGGGEHDAKRHDQGVLQLVRHRQGGTNAKNLDKHGVVLPQWFHKGFS
ncbi:hypothetical protein SDC9_87148 [bioreactor metagenome]|uniref:Uncharacterized protein n=1 Tax=bioreactor metagenome TaxID=1076179 RepID=A0A644ZSC6_9ZZZZ